MNNTTFIKRINILHTVNVKHLLNVNLIEYVTLDHKTSLIFVVIAKNTLYGSKWQIFILCQKSLGY